MLLYHGTSKEVANRAIKQGLRPRKRKASRWDNAPSNPNAVYLTDAYAPYFAFGDQPTVLVIDTDKLDRTKFMPDEDALEQATRGQDGLEEFSIKGMKQRTRFYRQNQDIYVHQGLDWKWSLKALGTCCYHGTIPPEAIIRVIFWDAKTVPMVFVFDPTITLINYRIMGARYRYLMQLLAKVEITQTLSDFDRFGLNLETLQKVFEKVTLMDVINGGLAELVDGAPLLRA